MLVQVTQDHISRGWRGNVRGCPIALALVDCGMEDVEVFPANAIVGVIRFRKAEVCYHVVTDPAVGRWACRYDGEGRGSPIKILMDLENFRASLVEEE